MKITPFVKISVAVIQVFLLALLLPAAGNAQRSSSPDLSPVRIALNSNGQLLVSEYTYGLILTVAPDTLDITNEFSINGRPLGVAWANDLIYVGNSTTGQVETYNAAGKEQFVLGHGQYPVETPTDIAIADNTVYVVDGGEKVVKIFTADGVFTGTLPENGYAPEILANPTAITVDAVSQKIFVSDCGDLGDTTQPVSPRIQVFNYDGSLSHTINPGVTNRDRFTMPQGLAVNKDGRLFVVDSLIGRIFIYDATTGTPVNSRRKTDRGRGRQAMKLPLDIVIDNTTDDVFVTNNQMAGVKVFEGAGAIQ